MQEHTTDCKDEGLNHVINIEIINNFMISIY